MCKGKWYWEKYIFLNYENKNNFQDIIFIYLIDSENNLYCIKKVFNWK